MKAFKIICISIALLNILSCKKEEEEKNNNEEAALALSINQNLQEIRELDEVTFSLNSYMQVTDVKWFLNDNEISSYDTWTTTFYTAGTFTLKAEVTHFVSMNSTAETTTVLQKQITVEDSPKYRVHIKKIEVMSLSGFNSYSNGVSNYLRTYFEIIEKDPLNVSLSNPTYVVKYISPENSANHGVSSFQTMSWDIAAANYKVWVYKTGNNHPNRQFTYTTHLKLYGRYSANSATAFNVLNNFKPSFNTYREVRPETMTFNNEGIQYRLTVEWEDYL